ncbi:MAG: MBL fold metallo-hydrolase [Isosphaeraceae bacterium]
MSIRFAALASGSSGNVSLIETAGLGVLIDIGIGPRVLSERLQRVGSGLDRVVAALLTHTHGDHVRDDSLAALARSSIPLYCHAGHRPALDGREPFDRLDRAGLIRHFEKDRPFLAPTGARVEPFELRHDGGPTFGFRVETAAKRKAKSVSIAYLADTGTWTDGRVEACLDVNLLALEFNHDVSLQRTSRRSPHLIARNLGDGGHLSNEQAAAFLTKVRDGSKPGALRHVVLLHLSRQCNRPDLAIEAARSVLKPDRRRVEVHAARHDLPEPIVNLIPSSKPREKSLVSVPF